MTKTEKKPRDTMEPAELKAFLKLQMLSVIGFADIIGVTPAAVEHWKTGLRKIPPTTAKLIRLFSRYPQLMEEF